MKLINSSLNGRKFKKKIGSSYNPYVNFGSILGPLLFSISMCDRFLCDYNSNIINYADDTTFYACEPNMNRYCVNLKKTPLQFIHGFRTTI